MRSIRSTHNQPVYESGSIPDLELIDSFEDQGDWWNLYRLSVPVLLPENLNPLLPQYVAWADKAQSTTSYDPVPTLDGRKRTGRAHAMIGIRGAELLDVDQAAGTATAVGYLWECEGCDGPNTSHWYPRTPHDAEIVVWTYGDAGLSATPHPTGSLSSLDVTIANPWTPKEGMTLTLGAATDVDVDLFDAGGRCVLAQRWRNLPMGSHRLEFRGAETPNGVYWLRARTSTGHDLRKLVVLQ